MKVQLEHILQNLFQRSSLEEVPVHELQEMVKDHPYFSAGHFLLAQKLKQQHTDEYEAQAQKAALYFHDPLWLQWQLKQPNGVLVESNGKETLEPEEELALTTVGPVEEAIPATPAEVIENIPEPEPEVVEVEPVERTEPIDQRESIDETETSTDFEHPAEQGSVREEAFFHEPEPQHETELVQDEAGPVQQTEPPAEQPPAQPIERPVLEPSIQPIDHTRVQKPDPPVPIPPKTEKEPESSAAPAFDPYYTIDYFASQGIKAPAEVQPGDRLGRQLKSFTEWLKTMKRLPQTHAEPPSEVEEQTIRQFAAGSLEEKEVVTEAMAEVLQKQGRNAEAIAIYKKLSLSDPSKSAYFAAKIENLKAN